MSKLLKQSNIEIGFHRGCLFASICFHEDRRAANHKVTPNNSNMNVAANIETIRINNKLL